MLLAVKLEDGRGALARLTNDLDLEEIVPFGSEEFSAASFAISNHEAATQVMYRLRCRQRPFADSSWWSVIVDGEVTLTKQVTLHKVRSVLWDGEAHAILASETGREGLVLYRVASNGDFLSRSELPLLQPGDLELADAAAFALLVHGAGEYSVGYTVIANGGLSLLVRLLRFRVIGADT